MGTDTCPCWHCCWKGRAGWLLPRTVLPLEVNLLPSWHSLGTCFKDSLCPVHSAELAVALDGRLVGSYIKIKKYPEHASSEHKMHVKATARPLYVLDQSYINSGLLCIGISVLQLQGRYFIIKSAPSSRSQLEVPAVFGKNWFEISPASGWIALLVRKKSPCVSMAPTQQKLA